VRHKQSRTQSILQAPARAAICYDDQQALMRGLVHGLILSAALWTAAFCLTFVLR
jgi:hypothetical protein